MNNDIPLDYITKLYEDNLDNTKSKGLDKVNSFNFSKEESINTIFVKVNNGSYRFTPYLEVLKSKGRKKYPRVISIPTLRDRLVFLILKGHLYQSFPECIDRKLPNHYVQDIKNFFETFNGIEIKNAHYTKLDIEKFYDRIDRSILLEILKTRITSRNILLLIENALRVPTVPLNTRRNQYNHYLNNYGIPQGLSISNILAGIYLQEFDKVIQKRKYFYCRYVDDILVINKNAISKFRIKNIEDFLKGINLELNNEKTQNGLITNGFEFLGYSIKGKLISVADKNIQALILRIAAKFTWFKNGMKYPERRDNWLQNNDRFKSVFIEELNDSITGIISSKKNYGWLFYFSNLNDIELLFKLDKIITSFFKKLEAFNNQRPSSLKKFVRAYHVIKNQRNLNYVSNFDTYNTLSKKRKFLIGRGVIDPEMNPTDDDLKIYFNRYLIKQKSKLEEDLGTIYS